MRVVPIFFLCFLILKSGKAQGIGTIDIEHITIVQDPKKIVMPKIISKDFCERIRKIRIPKNIKLWGDGGKEYYFIDIEVNLNKQGTVSFSRPRNHALPEVTIQIMKILKSSEWKVAKSVSEIKVLFQCRVEMDGINSAILKTLNNFQDEAICN